MIKKLFECKNINIYRLTNDSFENELVEEIEFDFHEFINMHETEIKSFCESENIDFYKYITIFENLIYSNPNEKDITIKYITLPYNDDIEDTIYINNNKYTPTQQGFIFSLINKNNTIEDYKNIFNASTLLEASENAQMIQEKRVVFFNKIKYIIQENLPQI